MNGYIVGEETEIIFNEYVITTPAFVYWNILPTKENEISKEYNFADFDISKFYRFNKIYGDFFIFKYKEKLDEFKSQVSEFNVNICIENLMKTSRDQILLLDTKTESDNNTVFISKDSTFDFIGDYFVSIHKRKMSCQALKAQSIYKYGKLVDQSNAWIEGPASGDKGYYYPVAAFKNKLSIADALKNFLNQKSLSQILREKNNGNTNNSNNQ